MTEESLFLAALEKHTTAERQAFLDEACGADAALRARVQMLLEADARARGILDRPAVGSPERTGAYQPNEQSSAYLAREQPGLVIAGRYKLLEQIGEGGMGAVWVAEQTQPVRRKVALKLIKAGMDSKSVLARFEAERQALAVMDHPNIAKVLDGGLTENGRPFFVMEYVKGVPITEYCDATRLSVPERLNLFVQVCQAVQHAHQKGIIHRDLKPSNILVAPYDDKPVPKVIDFGLAKAMHQSLTERTLHTAHETVLGTPLYMSPEQAQLNNLDVDTRSDIYSLGVLLYELLTGTTPLEKKRFKEAAWEEMKRLIREEEAPRPSTRLSSSNTLASLAAGRQIEPARLTKLVRGELDWIVMKSLEKDRGRRYETANGFAIDIQRHLAGEPVLAAPPSARYRLRKFARKHRAAVLTAAAILFVLLAGIVGTTFGLIRAEHRRLEAEQARADEAEQRQRAEAAKKKAEQAEADTLADCRASTDDAIEQLIGSKPELGPKEKTYLENTFKRWQAFAARQGNDERSRAIGAEGHQRVAALWRKLGRKEEARAEYQAARDIQKKLVEQFPAVPTYQQYLAGIHNDLGILLDGLGKREEELVEYQAARDIQKKLVEHFPAVPAYQHNLANTHHNLGILLEGLGKREEAWAEVQAAADIKKKLVEHFPAVPAYQRDLAATHNSLGNLLYGLGKREEARAEYQAARDICQKLVEQFPAVLEYQQVLASTHSNLGNLLRDLGKREEARTELLAARDTFKRLVEQFPAVPEYQIELARIHNYLGALLNGLGKREEARAEYQAALDLNRKLVEQFPAVPEYQIELGGSYCNYGALMLNEGKPAECLEWFDLAFRTLKPVHEKEPRNVTAKEFLRNSHAGRAQAHDRLQQFAEAVKDWDRAISLSPPAEQPSYRAGRAASRLKAGMVAEAVAEVAEMTKSPNGDAGQWYDFACVYSVASGKIAEKKAEYADRAMELLQKAVKAGYKDAAHMKKDTDLDSLRGRDDLKKLMAELEKK